MKNMETRKPVNLDLFCAGKLYVDLIFTGLPRFPILGEEILSENLVLSLGGGAAICAIGLSNLGMKAGIIGTLADSFFGDYIIHELTSHNVSIDFLDRVKGTENNISVSINADNDRSMIAFAKTDDYSEEVDASKKDFFSAKHFHAKGLSLARANLLKLAKKNGLTTSLDINLQTTNQAEMLFDVLPYVDVFLPSAWEMKSLFSKPPRYMVKELGKLVEGYCIIKLGSKGAIASEGSIVIEQASRQVKVLDATGAGDAFNAGFLWAYLRKEPVEYCLSAGAAAAELCLQTAGGISWTNQIDIFYKLMNFKPNLSK